MVSREQRPPRLYWFWLTGAGTTALGTQMLVFGLVWHAALLSPGVAAAVLSAQVVPRVLLTLHGGALSDRVGAFSLMVVANAVLCALATVGALAMFVADPGPVVMVLTALALGTVDAVNIPASASAPKLLVPSAAMGRAMAARQILTQGAVLCGPPLGGAALALLGLPATYGAGALGYLAMLVVLRVVRSRVSSTAPDVSAAGLNNQVGQGLRLVFGTPLLRVIVVLTGAFAMFVIPFSSLLVPVVSTARGWDSVTTGMASGAYGVGMACVTAVVQWRGTAVQTGLSASLGILIAGTAILVTGAVQEPMVFCLVALVVGLGTGVFSTHVGPLFMAACPREAVGRAQAVVTFAQWLPLLVANPLIGVLAQSHSAPFALVLWGAGAGIAGVSALGTRSFRTAVLPAGAERPQRERRAD